MSEPEHISSVLKRVLDEYRIYVNKEPLTVDQAARQRGYKVYDVALPQPWVDEQMEAGLDPRAHFVWCYDECKTFGEPAPITEQGDKWINQKKG